MAPRILLLGGHGRVALLMTPKIVARSWNLTSVIRNPDHKAEILEAGNKGPGKIEVLVSSLEEVRSEKDAKNILDQVKPDWVIWSAGAGGKGGPDRTWAIDRDACTYFIRSSLSMPSITKFLLISANGIRRNKAPWLTEEDWSHLEKQYSTAGMKVYREAKPASEDVLTVLGEERRQRDSSFEWISLRPGTLSMEDETGKVALGKTKTGEVPRGDVAEVAVRLLDKGGVNGWVDLLGGEEGIDEAIEGVVRDGVNAMEGEDVEVMRARISRV